MGLTEELAELLRIKHYPRYLIKIATQNEVVVIIPESLPFTVLSNEVFRDSIVCYDRVFFRGARGAVTITVTNGIRVRSRALK